MVLMILAYFANLNTCSFSTVNEGENITSFPKMKGLYNLIVWTYLEVEHHFFILYFLLSLCSRAILVADAGENNRNEVFPLLFDAQLHRIFHGLTQKLLIMKFLVAAEKIHLLELI